MTAYSFMISIPDSRQVCLLHHVAAVSLPSGPVNALDPETEMVEVEGSYHGV